MGTLGSNATGGTISFSRSPFRSWSFLATTAVCLLCITYDLHLLTRHWGQLSRPANLTLWMAGCGVIASWRRILSYHTRVRRAYCEGVLRTESGALGHTLSLAGEALNDSNFFSLTVILLLLVYAGHILA